MVLLYFLPVFLRRAYTSGDGSAMMSLPVSKYKLFILSDQFREFNSNEIFVFSTFPHKWAIDWVLTTILMNELFCYKRISHLKFASWVVLFLSSESYLK